MSNETIILLGTISGIIFALFLIFFVELISAMVSDFFESLYESKERKKQQVPKKIYPPKSEYIQSLIKVGKARSVSAAHFIENNFGVRSRLTFKSHEDKCKFLSLCDVIEQRDGFITDYEVVNLLSVTNKIKI